MAVVEVQELVVRYGDHRAVDGLTFSADGGEVVALLGPNGAGKTTTVETLEGYRRADGGQVRLLGLDPVASHRRLVPRIGVMLQKGGVYPALRVAEAVALFAAYYDNPIEPAELIERLGLDRVQRSTWRSLSGGEQQRLSLALAIVGRPEVAFLDEPTAGVDPSGRGVIRQIVGELRERGCCVVLSTHELDEAQRMADRVVIIDHGRLVAVGTPDELARSGGDDIRFGARPGLDVVGLGAAVGGSVTEDRPGEYIVAAPPTPATVAALTGWLAQHDVALADLRAGRQSLEDVFLRLTATDEADGAGSAT